MRNSSKQDGFIPVAMLMGIAALSMALIYFGNASSRLRLKTAEAENSRSTEDRKSGFLNAAAIVKGELTPFKDRDKKVYIPKIYPKNYFSKKWTFAGASSSERITAVKVPKLYFSPSGAEKIMSGDRSGLDMKPEVYNVDLERINISKKSKLLIESIDLVLYKNSSKMRFSARVPLSPPEPLDVQLRYRKKGGGDFITIKNGAVLNQGPYEFAVFASGIILDVDVISDGRPIEKLGGLGLNGAITHGATSYDSKDVQIGKTFELASSLKNTSQEKEHVLPPMISEKDLDLEGCKLVFSDPGSSENESAKTKTIILSAVAFGPDGIKKRSTGDLKISIAEEIKPETTVPTKSKTGSGDAPLTMADYTQLCTLECPHSPPLNADGSNPTVFSNQTAMKISRQFKIKNQKVCLDFTGADMNDESTTFQDKASVLVFDVKTCKARTLFKAGEWPIKALSCK